MVQRTCLLLLAWMFTPAAGSAQAAPAPLRIGYSDWPGWVAWQIAIDKGWLRDAGLDVKFEWFDYSASMEAFAAGKIDGDCLTNGDALVVGAITSSAFLRGEADEDSTPMTGLGAQRKLPLFPSR